MFSPAVLSVGSIALAFAAMGERMTPRQMMALGLASIALAGLALAAERRR